MAGYGNFQNFSKLGVIINWSGRKKIENSVIEPPTIRKGRVQNQKQTKLLCKSSINICNPVNILSAEIAWSVLEFKTLNVFHENL